MTIRGMAEPVRRFRHAGHGPAPIIGFERPPERLLDQLRAAAAEAAAAAGSLALLEAAPRSCGALLEDLAAHQARVERHAHDVRRLRPAGLDRRLPALVTVALADVATGSHDAAAWWCRNAACAPQARGVAGALRDATRALGEAIGMLPDQRAAERAVDVHRRVSEGRRLARRARAAAIDRGDLREVLGRMSAVAAIEGALDACGQAAAALQRLPQ